jgi:hypothetical protein
MSSVSSRLLERMPHTGLFLIHSLRALIVMGSVALKRKKNEDDSQRR